MLNNLDKHLNLTRSIISIFMQKQQNITTGLFVTSVETSVKIGGEYKHDKSSKVIKLNCIGHFDWLDIINNVNAQVVIFPIFFDLLDTYVDIHYGTINEKFSKKTEKIKKLITISLKCF